MSDMLSIVAANAYANQSKKEKFRDEHGVLRCKDCGKPLEKFLKDFARTVSVTCDCDEKAEKSESRNEQRKKAEHRAKENPLYDASYNSFTFERDDSPDSEAAKVCKAYVEHWEEVEKYHIGLLFSGTLGTGKSYYAAAVVNALRNKGVTAIIVTTSRLLNAIKAANNPQTIIDDLNKFQLVALDDLGAERDTEYAVEQLENFVNSRDLKKLPLIVTTNLSKKELDNPPNAKYARIFDRVQKSCCRPVILVGDSRRIAQAKARNALCKKILGI